MNNPQSLGAAENSPAIITPVEARLYQPTRQSLSVKQETRNSRILRRLPKNSTRQRRPCPSRLTGRTSRIDRTSIHASKRKIRMFIQYHPIGAWQETSPVTSTIECGVHGGVLHKTPISISACPFFHRGGKRTHRPMTSTQARNVPDQSMCFEVKF